MLSSVQRLSQRPCTSRYIQSALEGSCANRGEAQSLYLCTSWYIQSALEGILGVSTNSVLNFLRIARKRRPNGGDTRRLGEGRGSGVDHWKP